MSGKKKVSLADLAILVAIMGLIATIAVPYFVQ